MPSPQQRRPASQLGAQSSAQPQAFSAPLHTPSLHRVPQSDAQVTVLSLPLQVPSPQSEPQSVVQVPVDSPAPRQQLASPQVLAPQSPGQEQVSSPPQQMPSPQVVWPQSPTQLHAFS